MKIYITGLPSGYEVEHLVRLFYPMAPLTLTPPEAGEDCVWAEKKPDGLWAMVRQGGKCAERSAPLPAPAEAGGETPEFSLASSAVEVLRETRRGAQFFFEGRAHEAPEHAIGSIDADLAQCFCPLAHDRA